MCFRVGGGVEITFADADTLEWETRFIDAALSFQDPGTVGENIIATTKILNNYAAIQSFIFPILR